MIGSEGGRGSVMTEDLSKTVSWSRIMSDGVEDQIERISSGEKEREIKVGNTPSWISWGILVEFLWIIEVEN